MRRTWLLLLPIDLHAYWLECMRTCEFAHLHLGGILSHDELKPLAESARAHGATISMDCQDAPNLVTACAWKQALCQVDIFMPNAREALIISGTEGVEQAMRRLLEWTHVIVIKDGAHGAWIGCEDEVCHIPPIHAGPVVDTTGAGDSFVAGFLAGLLRGWAPERCARLACAAAALNIQKVGATAGMPTYEEANRFMEERLQKRR